MRREKDRKTDRERERDIEIERERERETDRARKRRIDNKKEDIHLHPVRERIFCSCGKRITSEGMTRELMIGIE